MSRFLGFAALLLVASPAAAQHAGSAADRYELGRRLKAFEAAWEKYDDPAGRKRALAILPQVTGQFFTNQLGEAGRTLDLAAFALQSDAAPSAARQWGWSLVAVPEARVVDGAAAELAVTVKPYYEVKGDPPKNLELQFWFTDKQVTTVKPDKFPVTVKVPLPPLGDHKGLDRKLYFLADGTKELRPAAVGVSQIADLKKRLGKFPDAPEKRATIEEATAARRAAAVARAAGIVGKGPDFAPTDLPYAELLANAETMLDGKPFFTADRPGQFWVSVPTASGPVVECRVFVPKGLGKAKPVPVVFALHGAGADENTFFEGYGAGLAVKECEKRGWVLVAPRAAETFGPGAKVADLFDALAKRYPLDPKRVFVVGHSMGAVQALGQAADGKFAAVALLGGGARAPKPEALAAVRVFIGVGAKDGLALGGARNLNKELTAAGAKAVTFKEYPDVEHLVIVREALPDVFAVFDAAAK